MSNNLNEIVDLAANYPPQSTLVVSNTSYSVLLFLQPYLSSRTWWIDRTDPLDEITDAEWDELEEYIDRAYKELMTPMIGQIIAYVTASPTSNVLPCDGSQYLRVDFPDLYAILDAVFIVDADHFRVPDLRGRTVIGIGTGTGLTPRTMNEQSGEEAVILTEPQLAVHTHTNAPHQHTYNYPTLNLDFESVGVPDVFAAGNPPIPSLTSATSVTIDNAGGDEAHENMSPFVALRYCIVAR